MTELIKIRDMVLKYGISARTLKYYEQVGLIQSVRSGFGKYRYYDDENVARIKQIMVLRKMEMPIKDILCIYENEDMSVVVETFVNRIRTIDEEVDNLTELRALVNDFLQAMLQNGITKISALPILYEQMEKQLDTFERSKSMSYKELSALSDKMVKSAGTSIIHLPSMRVLSSRLKDNLQISDLDGFWHLVQTQNIAPGEPGRHERFEFQTHTGDVVILRIADDFINDSNYTDYIFDSGLYAAANVYLDEDLGQHFRALVYSFDENKFYEIDYARASMLENLISPDEKRELVSLLVPVKKRLSDPALFDKPEEATDISAEEIEAQNPVLWEVSVPLDSLTPINDPYYLINERGEAEYTGWVNTRVLSTNVEVKLPFRVDIEFRFDEDTAQYSYGSDEGAISFYHGIDVNYIFGINMGNRPDETLSREALRFHQPTFRDFYDFPNRGRIDKNIYNKLTWIVGEKHFAVIVNGEIRYCCTGFPYMETDLSRSEPQPIILGSNGQGMKYYRSVHVSQLVHTTKIKIKEGEIIMITKRSNNILPNIHRFITSEHGENYWFNGCGRYVMGAIGEKDYDYEFFAGLTGDVFAQVYPYDHFRGDGVTDYNMSIGNSGFVENIFNICGYAASFVPEKQLKANREMYLQTLIAYIDKGTPVISNLTILGHGAWIVFVGYEEYGKTLLFMTDNMTQPERISIEDVFSKNTDNDSLYNDWSRGWVFVGEKKEQRNLKQLYHDIIIGLPKLLTTKTDKYCFGAEAFRAWAADIEKGKFDGMKPEEFNGWIMYSTYVCNGATNSSCCHEFLRRACELNPDMKYLEDVSGLYRKMEHMWNGGLDSLETLGGGFNVTLDALQDRTKSGKIIAKIREFADCVDEVIRILNEKMN